VDEDQVVVEEVRQLIDVPLGLPAERLDGEGVDLVLDGRLHVRIPCVLMV
jgi:hypothetical protein